VLATELHGRITFRRGRASWGDHCASGLTVLLSYLFTTGALLAFADLHPGGSALLRQGVYLAASGAAGIARFLLLRCVVFAQRPTAVRAGAVGTAVAEPAAVRPVLTPVPVPVLTPVPVPASAVAPCAGAGRRPVVRPARVRPVRRAGRRGPGGVGAQRYAHRRGGVPAGRRVRYAPGAHRGRPVRDTDTVRGRRVPPRRSRPVTADHRP